MNLELKGKVVGIKDVQHISDKFRKQVVVVEYIEKDKPKTIALEFVNDNIEKIMNLQINDKATFKFNLNCREHNSNFYLSSQCWSVNS
jgi:hypothetical protein